MNFKNRAGFSLVEIMVAVGIMSGVTLAIGQLLSTMNKNFKRAELRESVNQDHLEFETLLMSRDACTNTFGPLGSLAGATPAAPIPVPFLVNGDPVPLNVFEPGNAATNFFPRPPGLATQARYRLINIDVVGFTAPNQFRVSFRYQFTNPEIVPRDYFRVGTYQATFNAGNAVLSCNNDKANEYDAIYLNRTGNEVKEGNLDIIGRLHLAPTVADPLNTGYIYAQNFFVTSDERKKQDIKKIEFPMQKILKIRGVEFDWILGGRHDWGVIAQDVEKVSPELVHTIGEGQNKTVNYNGLVALSIEGLKELQGENEKLNREVTSLEDQATEIKKAICKKKSQHSFCKQ
jgi:hypothetical protein